jgi:simple sugar transport system ATP-binding protein
MGSVAENLVSTTYFTSDFSRWSVLNNEKVRRFATESIERYNIAAEGPEAAVSTLSGGNAQKLVVARELTHDPAVLLAAHPTRGLDIRAAQFVRSQLLRLRENGVGVLLISADLEELFALSDRILVIFDGRIVGECDPASTSYEELGLLMSGAREQNGTTDGSSNDGSKEDTSNNGADL